jgi:hypothetical protein
MKKFSVALIISALCLNFVSANDVTVESDEEENLFKNGSFEEIGKNEFSAKNWDSVNYQPAIRTQEKSFSGKYCMKMTGDGEKAFALRQIIPGTTLNGKKKLEVSACFYFTKSISGHLLPIYFIVNDNGKQSWPSGRSRRNSDPREKWFKAGTTLDLTKYSNIKYIEVYVLGWKYKNKYFSGTVYIDDFEAFAE